MSRVWTGLVILTGAFLVSSGPLGAQAVVPAASRRAESLVTAHPSIQASLERIAAGSALWRQAIGSIAAAGRKAAILTADQVIVADADGRRGRRSFDPTVLAEVAPLAGPNSRVDAVMVVVNLALLEQSHWARGSQPWELQDDLDRILIHEVYGHAVPYLLAGDLSGHCADTRDGERAESACAIQRENAVRAELGLGRRRDAGLDGLALTRPASR